MLKSNYYSSINDLPLHNWRKCTEEQDHRYVRKDINKGTEAEDGKIWIIIYDAFLKEFGLGKDYERILELTKEIALLECDYVLDDGEFLRNQITHLKLELQELLDKPVEHDMDAVIIWMEKWLGFGIDENVTTVRKFYKILKEHKREADRMKQNNKK